MRLTAHLELADPKRVLANELTTAMLPYQREDRAQVRIEERRGKVSVRIEAKDSTAMRAAINSILKLMTVYEKAQAFA